MEQTAETRPDGRIEAIHDLNLKIAKDLLPGDVVLTKDDSVLILDNVDSGTPGMMKMIVVVDGIIQEIYQHAFIAFWVA